MEGVPAASTEGLVHQGAPMPTEGSGLAGQEGGSPRVWLPGRRLLTVGMVTLITIAASESLAVTTVMPLVERELGGLALYGWIFSAFMLGNILGIVTAGRLTDRIRPGAVLAGGLALFVAGLVGATVTPSMAVLVGARLLQGIGAGVIPTVGTVVVARAYPPAARPRMFALFSTAWVLPSLVGPAVAALVGERWGWRWVFAGLIPLAVAAGGITIVALLPIGVGEGSRARHPKGAWTLALVVGVGLLIAGLQVEPRWLGVGLIVLGLVLASRSLLVLLPPGTFAVRPGLPATVVAKALFMYAFFAADAFVPLSLTSLRGVSPAFAGAVVSTVSLTWSAFSWVAERLVRRIGPRALVRVGFLLVAAGAGLVAMVVVSGVPVALAFPTWALAGAGAGLLFGPLSAAGLAAASSGEEGRASSSLLLAEALGFALGTGVAGALVAATQPAGQTIEFGVAGVFAVSAAVAAVGAVIASRIPRSVLHRPA